MNDDTASAELAARKGWTLARLGEFINGAREAGWVVVDPIDTVSDPGIFKTKANGLVGDTPMRVLQARLGLSAVEMDVLWLLACIELEPALAGAAQLLVARGMHELNAQVLIKIAVGDDDDAGR